MSASTAAANTTSLNRPDAAAAAGAGAAHGASAATGAGAGNTAANINGEVWSSLLQSVASSRLVPTKDVLILGDPHSGKSTLIELLKTALPTLSSDALANGDDGSGTKTVNGVVLPSGPNGGGNTGNGSAPVMVEMGTGTSEDNIFGQKKNDLALSYSYWNVEDDENEGMLFLLNLLGLYQIAGSHRSYHALLKYCLNTKTIADTIVMIVLDWSKPWTFMETLQRWIKVLEGALQHICQEGAVAGAAWSKGKALMDELEEKLSRFLQEYTEPQPHPSLGTANYSDTQSYVLGSNDAQSVLLPLTEGCLTNNTGVPIVIVCTKSDHINILEREMDYQEETFDYIQQSLRTICLKYGASLFYTSIHHPHTFANLRQYLLHRLLTPSTLNNPQPQPSSFAFKQRAQVVERDQVMVPAGWDTIGKIKVLKPGFDCEGVAEGWELDDRKAQAPEDQALTESGVATAAGAQQVYEEVIVNPKRNHAPATIQPVITAEDDQVFLDRFVETLQRANERPGVAMGSAMGGSSSGSHSAHGSVSGPPVVGPLGSGYTSMLNSHHAASPPPAMSASMSGSQSIGRAGGRTVSGSNGYDSDDVEGRLKMLASKTKVNGGASASSGLIGPALSEGGLATANMKLMASMMSQGRSNSGSPPVSGSVGGMATTSGVGSAATVGAGSAAQGQVQTEVLSNFFQSLLTRKTTTSVPGVGSPASGSTSAPSNDP
ncbi:hypothetical protein BGZ75_003883 [Mortierella antarctica]|nr:hypothetical protein BGZ67_000348 [Mortierella alpina]KAF9984559.1 hypothetical protein BGZ75_003883 [Mortierella antarctica]